MKKRFLQIICICLCVTLAFAALAACGDETPVEPQTPDSPPAQQPDTPPAPAPDPVEPPPTPPATDDTITINLMTLWARDNTENIASSLRARVALYQDQNPNVVVVEEGIGDQTAYYTRLTTLAAANDLPDVFVCRGSELSMFAQSGLVAPLNDILNANPGWRDGYVDGAFDDLTTDGSVFAVPYSMLSTHVIYYNSDLLNAAGFSSFPQTWSEFLDMVAALNANGITPIALGNREQWVANSCLFSTLGDRFTGSDWFRSIISGSGAQWTDPDFVNALAALQELKNAGAFNDDLNSINNDDQKTLFYNGEAAMFMEGSWAIGAVVDEAPADVLAAARVAVLPAVNGGRGNPRAMSGGSGSGLAVGVKALDDPAKMAVIADFLEFVLGEDYSKDIASKGEPAAFAVSDYDTSNVPPLAALYAEMASSLAFSPIYDSFLNPAVNGVLNEGLQELLINVITPQALAERLQAENDRN